MGANVQDDGLVPQLPVEVADEMSAFDRLPESVRRKISEGPYSLAALSVIVHWSGVGGPFDEQELLEALDDQFSAMIAMRSCA